MNYYREWEGEIVPHSFISGYVVMSFVVSYVGALTTLELLHRRTSSHGAYNMFLVFASSISMGGVAIWCMHFIGNRAIVMSDGQPQLQIEYSSGFTALSFFIPILVVLAAFVAVGSNEEIGKPRVVLGGALAGFAICGMHYIGQAGIANYTSVYTTMNVVASAAIAVITSITTLMIFFVLRAQWTNSWWKRALCGVLLACTVSGMHWVASAGTRYRFRHASASMQSISRDQIVIVVIVFSLVACAMLLTLAMFAQRRRSKSADRSKQVVLSCATFDSDGRLMVTPGGLLPSQKITNSYIERSFDELFSVSHPVFLWVFRTTRNWFAIRDLLPRMREHLLSTTMMQHSRSSLRRTAPNSSSGDANEDPEDFSLIFKELFCIAAAELAEKINESVENLGVLYDDIMSTGTTSASKKNKLSAALSHQAHSARDVEMGRVAPVTYGRGQLLFVVRQTNKGDTAKLQAHGFRFAEVQNVVDILAKAMQVERTGLLLHLKNLRDYAKGDQLVESGVHIGCFAMKARLGGGFDVLVRKAFRNRLPTLQLRVDSFGEWHEDFLRQANGMTIMACITWLAGKTAFSTIKEELFAAQFHGTLTALMAEFTDPLIHEAVIAKPMMIPCRGIKEMAMPGKATLIAFRIIVPVHTQAMGPDFVFSPFSVFRCRQHVYKNAPDHDVFARAVHREFAPIQQRPTLSPYPSYQGPMDSIPRLTPSKRLSQSKPWWGPLSALERRPLGITPTLQNNMSNKDLTENQNYGGIMVSQEVSIDITPTGNTAIEMRSFGTSGCATTEVNDSETFADQLFASCVESL